MTDNEELPPDKYHIPTMKNGEVVGKILCSRPGLRLIDFYRTSPVLACDIPVRGAEVNTSEGSALAETRNTRTGGATPPTGAIPNNQ